MAAAKSIGGYLAAALLIILAGWLLVYCFQAYGLWTLLYLPQAYVLLMYLYVFIPALILCCCYPWLKQMFISCLPSQDSAFHYFTILIPAHNEEALLPGLLASIQAQTFSKNHFQVIVVADNCTDNTAIIARQYNVNCLERTTGYPSDKQQALRYGMEQFFFTSEYNAGFICIVDADCRMHPDFLREMNSQLTQDNSIVAMQSFREVNNVHATPVTLLDGAAEALRNWAFCAPRKWLGGSVFINGSGILFTKKIFDVLVQLHGHQLAEDKEWKAYLSERKIKVDYCACAKLTYEAVTSQSDFQRQRRRWVGSHMSMLAKYGWKAFKNSILGLNITLLDFFFSLMQIPRSLLLICAIFFAVLDFMYPPASFFPHWAWIAMLAGMLLYGMLGMALTKATLRDYKALPYSLSLIAGIIKTTLQSFAGKGAAQWKPTRTKDE